MKIMKKYSIFFPTFFFFLFFVIFLKLKFFALL